MSNKKEIEEAGLSTEAAKALELDVQPKPTRKISQPPTPSSNKEPNTHDKRTKSY